MKILLTGATGVLGQAAVPALLEAGHDVSGVARNDHDFDHLDHLGARPLAVDLFDARSIAEAMAGIDTVIHHATSIPTQANMPKRASWNLNDRLRDTATDLLVDAAIAEGVTRFVQQSVTFSYADGGRAWLDETSPIEPIWDVLDSALAAESHVARFTSHGGTGVVLRLSRLYGPGKASGGLVEAVANRKMPVIGRGVNFVSSIHVEDATSALAAALSAPGGTYNVTDDDPVTSADYVGVMASLLNAPAPRHVPGWMARLIVGKASRLLTISQRVSNEKFATTTGWRAKYPSVREGFDAIVTAGGE